MQNQRVVIAHARIKARRAMSPSNHVTVNGTKKASQLRTVWAQQMFYKSANETLGHVH